MNANSFRVAALACALACLASLPAPAEVLNATFPNATTVPLTAAGYSATGNTAELALGFAPTPGTGLTVVENTALDFIAGRFDNLAHGQAVTLEYGGIRYPFTVNYYGGSGNDLVLEWANGRLVAWGDNYEPMLGDGTNVRRNLPVPVVADGVLAGKTVTRVSVGERHTLALCSDGTLATWGDGAYGQLGNGSGADSTVPVAVRQTGALAGKTVVAVSAGHYHSLVLCSDGTLVSWGQNYNSQLGNGTGSLGSQANEPVWVVQNGVLAGKAVVAISAGGWHNLVLCADGTLASWGSNSSGALGNNTTTSNVPVLVDRTGVLAGKSVVAISAGPDLNLVACSDGTVAAWGFNGSGQLGNATTATSNVPVLVDRSGVLAGRAVTAVEARGGNYYDRYHSLALCSDGSIVTWGASSHGQLGNGSTTDSLVPLLAARVGALSGKTPLAVFAGGSSSYALCADGSLAGWGGNTSGQLGNGSVTDALVPVAVLGLGTGERLQSVGAGYAAVVARTALPPAPIATTLAATGIQDTGAVLNASVSAQGNATVTTFEFGLTTAYGSTVAASPASVSGTATTAVSATLSGLVAGTTYHFRGVAASIGGRVTGADQTFTTTDLAGLAGLSLSDGSLAPEFTSARTTYVATVANATASVGVTPVVAQDGAIVTVNGVPVVSGSASAAVNLAVGTTTISVGVTAAGGVTTRGYTLKVTRLPATFTFTAATSVPVTAADFSAGGLTANLVLSFAPPAGTSLTVVNNTGSESIRGSFANLAQGQAVNLVYSGVSYPFVADYFGGTGNDLVLRWGNTRLLTWGYNSNGQLGRGNLDLSNVPVAADMSGALLGKTVTAVAAGSACSFALTSDGRVAAWGQADSGQLGNNDWGSRSLPVAVDSEGALFGRRVRTLAGRNNHILAVCTDGTLVAWGDNDYGQASGDANWANWVPTELVASGVLAGRQVTSLAAGSMHSLALCADGTLGAWGGNGYGQLGMDSSDDSTVPLPTHQRGVLAGKTVVAVASGGLHNLALCSDGTLAAWGNNEKGQLGDGTTTTRLVPVAVNRSGVLAGKTVTALAAGAEFSLVLCSDGTLASWGYGAYGQLGNGSNNQNPLPVLVTRTGVLSGKTVTQISAGFYHSLALCSDGTLAAWGSNDSYCTLGNGTFTNSSTPVLVNTTALRSGERFLAVVAGGTHNIALVASPPPPVATTLAVTGITDTGATLRGSANANGLSTSVSFQYGLSTSYGATVTASPATLTGTTAAAVSVALTGLITGTTYHYRVVATSAGGTIYGEDLTFITSKSASLADLRLSEGVLLPDFSPAVIAYAASVPNAAASVTVTPVAESATSTVTVNGVAVPSGSASAPLNLNVGNNTLTVVVTPQGAAFTKTYTITVTRLPAVFSFASATTVPVTAAAFRASGHTIQFGLSFTPTVGTSLTVVRNTGSLPIQGVFTNLVQGQRVVLSFGNIDYPFVADYFGGTGNSHSLALCADGTLASWGGNDSGQLGSSMTPTNVPVLVDRSGVLAEPWPITAAAGSSHNLVLCADGTLATWGSNSYGQLGAGGTVYQSAMPLAVNPGGVLAGQTLVAVAAGDAHNLVLCSDGTLASWGSNGYGQLGNGTSTNSNLPVAVNRSGVLSGKTITAIAAGAGFNLVLCSDGTLATWGRGDVGALGNGGVSSSNVPVLVTRSGVLSGKTVTAIACGGDHSLVLCSDGTLASWGYNGSGQLGNGGTTQSNVPVLVDRNGILSGKTVVGLAGGGSHSLAWCSDASVAAWGSNANGRLGNNSTSNSSTPVLITTTALRSGERIIGAAAGYQASYAIVASPPAPQVTTLAATAVADGGATLNGSVDAEGRNTSVSFEYGLTTAYGSTLTATPAVLSASTAAAASANLAGLVPGTAYHFRVVAIGPGGTVKGADQSFTTTTLATLAGLTASEGALTPAFQFRTARYSLAVASTTASLTLRPVAASAQATVTVNGTPVVSGGDSQVLSLATGNNTVAIAVNAGAGNSLTYTLIVTRLPASFAFASAATIPVTVEAFAPGGLNAAIALNFAPQPGTALTLVNNTGFNPIQGTFANLSQGQRVDLAFGGVTYAWVADYFGGSGNDLVLRWANTRILAWGYNASGQLGENSTANATVPTAIDPGGVLAGETITAVTVGRNHSLALCADGSLAAWGENGNGQLGDGTSNDSRVPLWTDLEGDLLGKRIVRVAAGDNHTLALCADGTLAAWGGNDSGQLGNGATTSVNSLPLLVNRASVLAGKTIIDIAAGTSFSLVLCADGTLATWGLNSYGQIGDGTTQTRKLPVLVDRSGVLAGKTITAISAGGSHCLVLCSDGTLAAWGANAGRLGNGETTDRSLPVLVTRTGVLAGKTITAISAGNDHNLVLCSDGTLAAWGDNWNGELGNGQSYSSTTTPVLVTRTGVLAGKTVTTVLAGANASLAGCTDGSLATWGSNTYGSLGNGTTADGTTPVLVSAGALRTGERPQQAAYSAHALLLAAGPPAPTASTLTAESIHDTGATLRGQAGANGAATTLAFEYGLTTAYGTPVAATPAALSGTATADVTAVLGGLVSGATYHFRLIATSTGGTARGNDQTFITTTSASLAGLTVSAGTLDPAFLSTVTSYHLALPPVTASLTLTPVTSDAAATVTVNGLPVASGTASDPVALNPGNQTVEVVVTPPGAGTAKTYRVTATRLPETFAFGSAADVPVTVGDFIASGLQAAFALNFAPAAGTNLTVIRNTGNRPISGAFANLAQGQRVRTVYQGVNYDFLANYFGGDGNDLVLQWAFTRLVAWGFNYAGQLGNGASGSSAANPTPVAIVMNGVLAGKTQLGLAAGSSHCLALNADGSLAAWGDGSLSQLGNSPNASSSVPISVVPGALAGKTTVAVGGGASHSLALCSDGTLAAWGYNVDGQLGYPGNQGSGIPKAIDPSGALAGKRVTAITTRSNHNVVLCSDGTLIAWGGNGNGQLGNGTTTNATSPTPVNRAGVLAGKTVVAVATGAGHTLALCSDGTLAAWGYNNYGQLGNNTTTNSNLPVLVDRSGVLTGKTVTAIACGGSHNLALCFDGTLAAWGYNSNGQLGNGTTTNSSVPVLVNRSGVLAGKTIIQLAAGNSHSLAVCADGTAAAWGSSSYGELGNGTTTASNVPVMVSTSNLAAGERILAVAAGSTHSLAIVGTLPPPIAATLAATSVFDTGATLNGRVEANGANAAVSFEYGLTTAYGSTTAAVPGTVTGTDPTAVSALLTGLRPGTAYHFRLLANTPSGTVRGEDLVVTTTAIATLANLAPSAGSLLPAFTSLRTRYDLTVPYATTSIAVTPTPAQETATLTVNGAPLAGGATSPAIPLLPGANPVEIAVTSADGVSTLTYSLTVTRLPEIFAFDTAATVPASAGGFGLSGAAVIELRHVPAPGAALTVLRNTGNGGIAGRFDNLAQGQTVILNRGGIDYPFLVNYFGGDGNDLVLEWASTRLFAWGDNSYGQLGDGTGTNRLVPSPVDVSGVLAGRTVIGGGCGEQHSAVLCADGSLFAWGYNNGGQLGTGGYGTGSYTQRPVAVVRTGVLAGKNVVALSVGRYHNLVRCDDGTVFGWGANSSGQLGDGSTTDRNVPVATRMTGALAGRKVLALSAGGSHSLALCDDGTVAAWGYNSTGQLGNGTTVNSSVPVAVDQTGVLLGKQVVALAAANDCSYALCADGTVAAWGGNGNGQLGDNSKTTRLAPVLVHSVGVLAGKTVVALAQGSLHAVVLCSDGTLAAWGYNGGGQLGNGTTTDSSVPVLVNRAGVLAGKVVRSVHAGSNRSFALCDDGTLAAWGNNASGALGNNSTTATSTPVLASMVNLRAGEQMVRPLTGCYTQSNLALIASPVPARAATLAASNVGDHGAILRGSVNANGQSTAVTFEYGPTAAYGITITAVPATVTGTASTAVEATVTGLPSGTIFHYRVVAENGGGITRGEDLVFTTTDLSALTGLALGEAAFTPTFAATQLAYRAVVSNAVENVTVVPQPAHPDATVKINGTLMPAGGAGVPVALVDGENPITVAVSSADGSETTTYSITVTRLPEVFAFAAPTDVPVTIGTFAGAGTSARFALNFAPVAAANLLVVNNTGDDPITSPFDNLAQGQRVILEHGGVEYPFVANYFGGTGNDLVLQWANTRLLGWGSNEYGKLGDDTTTTRLKPSPTDPGGILVGKTVIAAATGYAHSLALCADGSLFAWGANDRGQLGDRTTTTRLTPVPVARDGALASKTVVAIATGDFHNLALCADGSLFSWGGNDYGQLGSATVTGNSTEPVAVDQTGVLAGKRIVSIATAGSHNLVLCADGTLASWGVGNSGQLGNGGSANSNVPGLVDRSGVLAGKRVIAACSGGNHDLVLCADGTVATWGYNYYGQLGNGSSTNSSVPVLVDRSGVLAGKSVVAIAAGGSHNLVRCSDGSLASWGRNDYGQLGNGSTSASTRPVLVSPGVLAGKTVRAITAGNLHNVALCGDGTLAAWGYNGTGAVGNNSTTTATVPVAVDLTSLRPGEAVFAVGSNGSSSHSLAILGSPPAPRAETLAASEIGDSAATLRGSAAGNGSTATVNFEYGLGSVYGSKVAAVPATVNGAVAVAVSAPLAGLLPGTVYHFRTVVSGPGGTAFGADRTFTTGSASALAGLAPSAGALTPTFVATVFDYQLTVPFSVAALSLTPVAADPAATVKVNGTLVASGVASPALPLAVGANGFTVEVTAPNGIDKLAYRVAAVRLPEVFAFHSASGVPLTVPGLVATGQNISLLLNHAPVTGAALTVVKNTGTAPITGTFANLPRGATVELSFGGIVYSFVANYHGGTGNDLVLQWANTRVTGWGYNQNGQIGDGTTTNRAVAYEPWVTAKPAIDAGGGDTQSALLLADGTIQTPGGGAFTDPAGVLAGRAAVMIEVGGTHSLGLCDDGALFAWGYNGSGQLGNGTTTSSNAPVLVDRSGVLAGKTVTALSAGGDHCLVLCSDGTLAAWGENGYGQLGNNSLIDATRPVLVDRSGVLAGKTVVAIASGESFSLVLCSDGTLAAWGDNSNGQLGNGSTTNSSMPVLIDRSGVLAARTVTAIFAGYFHSGALCGDGNIVAWGNNVDGQLGNNSTTSSPLPVLVSRTGVLAGKTVIAVDGAGGGTIATCNDGTLASWGDNWSSQLGDGTSTNRSTPVLVDASSLRPGQRFIQGYAGDNHRIALVAAPPRPLAATLAASDVRDTSAVLNGTAGANGLATEVFFEYGPTGAYGATLAATPGSLTAGGPRPVAATLANLPPASTWHFRMVARSEGGTTVGEDQTFTTGNAAALASLALGGADLAPSFEGRVNDYVATVPHDLTSVTLTAVAADPTATIHIAETLVPSGSASEPLPLAVGTNPLVVRVDTDGGVNTRTYRVTVTRLPEGFVFQSATGALLSSANFAATGAAPPFVLNFAPAVGTSLVVVDNTGGSPIYGSFTNLAQGQLVRLPFGGVSYAFLVDYRGGNGNDLVLRWAHTRLVAWGSSDYGQVGDGTSNRRSSPVAVDASGALAGKSVRQFAVGGRHTLALCTDGSMAAWGSNASGQLGTGNSTSTTAPVAVDPGTVLAGKTIVAVAAGHAHNLALCDDGTLAVWGDNTYGQVGDGTTSNRNRPVAVNTLGALAGRRVVEIAAGTYHSLALCADGTLVTWGQNSAGQLGDGTTTARSLPVAVDQTGALSGKRVAGIAAGAAHCLARCSDGTVFAWGSSDNGQLGYGLTGLSKVPVAVNRAGVLANRSVTAITAGWYHSMALCTDGTVAAWGDNSYGQLGNSTTTDSSLPLTVSRSGPLAGKTIVGISAGESHSVARCSDGTVAAWGRNFFGQLGNETTTDSSIAVAVSTAGLRPGERLMEAGSGPTAAHSVAAIGTVPPPLATTLPAAAVADNRATLHGSASAQGSASTVWFEYGLTTGYGNSVAAVPAAIGGIDPVPVELALENLLSGTTYHFRMVAANDGGTGVGEDVTFTTGDLSSLAALTPSAGVLTPSFAGSRLDYSLMLPFADDRVTLTPVCVHEGATVTVNGQAVASGSASEPLPLAVGETALTVVVTGADTTTAQTYRVAVVRLPESFGFAAASDVPLSVSRLVASGMAPPVVLSYAPVPGTSLTLVRVAGTEPIWGRFANLAPGQEIYMSFEGIYYPFIVNYRGGSGNDLVLEWGNHRPLSWGGNSSGSLGDGGTASSSLPVPVFAGGALWGRQVTAVSSSNTHTLALCADGTVAAWGDSYYGQLGVAGLRSSNVPVRVNPSGALAGKRVIAVDAGRIHSLALCDDGTLAAWGENSAGQLGNNTTVTSALSVQVDAGGVLAGQRVVAISAGGGHSLALTADGWVAAWGSNSSGQLGIGTTTNAKAPMWVDRSGALAGKRVVAISAGDSHSLALCSDGKLVTWGANGSGQLGNNSTTTSSVPVLTRTGAFAGKTPVAIACGENHNLVLCSDGSLVTWGANGSGQLGNNGTTNSQVPVAVSPSAALAGKSIVKIVAGITHNLVLCDDGSAAAWGYNVSGGLGNGTTANQLVPVAVSPGALQPGERWDTASAGSGFSVGLAAGLPPPVVTTLAADGLLDTGATLHGGVIANGPDAQVTFEYGLTADYGSKLDAIPATASGYEGQSARATVGGLLPGTTYHFRLVAANANGTSGGPDLTFTTTSFGTLSGLSLSAGALAPSFEPTRKQYLTTIPFAAASLTVTPVCSDAGATVTVNGAAVGSGSPSNLVPMAVGENMVTVAVNAADGINGSSYVITVHRLPEVLTFDSPTDKPLVVERLQAAGNLPPVVLNFPPAPGTRLTLVDLTGPEPLAGAFANLAQGQVVDLDHGGNTYRFVADYRGGDGNDLELRWFNSRVIGWGNNSYGQLGNNGSTNSPTPVATEMGGVLAGKAVMQVGSGTSTVNGTAHSVALCADGTLATWGASYAGAVGGGTQSRVPLAVDQTGVLAGRRAVQSATGADFILVLCDDGALAAWGYNGSGQLGDGGSLSRSAPVLVDRSGVLAGKTVVQVAAGMVHGLVLCSDGTVAAWGGNSAGQLGNPASSYSLVPVPVVGIPAGKRVAAIAAGGNHSLALCTDGSLYAWGSNNYGQLGNNSVVNSTAPVAVDATGVLAGRSVVAISAGYSSNLVLCSDGTLIAWGSNSVGQLGNNSTANSGVPVEVVRDGALAGQTVKAVSMIGSGAFALGSDGTLFVWGDSILLGGSTSDSRVPIPFPTTALRAGEVFLRMASGSNGYHALAVTALPLPTSATLAASQITGTRALLQGTVNARENATTVRFEYGLDDGYGTTVAATPASLAGKDDTVIGTALGGLLPNTTYHFRAVAECAGGVIRGEDRSFTTRPAGSPPVFAGYQLTTPWQTPVSVALRKLLAKASDPDGEAFAVTAAGPASTGGGTVVLLLDAIRYTSPNGFSGIDTFPITLTDSDGTAATGTVTVTVGPAPNAGAVGNNPPVLTLLPGGKVGLVFHGIPGRNYIVQRSVAGLDDWETLATLTAEASGRVNFTDESPPQGSAFYRLGLP